MKWKPSEVVAIAPESVSGNSFCGSTGHWPVPPGDPPGGTGSAPGSNKDGTVARSRLALPVGGSPTSTGGSPVLPIFGRCCGSRGVTDFRGQCKEVLPNDFHKPVRRFIGTHPAILMHEPPGGEYLLVHYDD